MKATSNSAIWTASAWTFWRGQIATIRDGHQAPDQPTQATPSELTDAANRHLRGSDVRGQLPVHHLTTVADHCSDGGRSVPAIVIPIATRGSRPYRRKRCAATESQLLMRRC